MSIVVQVKSASIGLNSEITCSETTSLSSLMDRMYAMTGFKKETMVFKAFGRQIEDLNTEMKDLEQNKMVELSVDGEPEFGDLESPGNVPKVEISDEEYARRKGTAREFKKKLGAALKGDKTTGIPEPQIDFKVGDRCLVSRKDGSTPLGTVRYIGHIKGKNTVMAGVELDQPVGKNDGSHKGERYFHCADKHGIFVIPRLVTAGDFSERVDEM